ncbi:nickel import ATP-binding protein NikE [Vibrio tritonius]|uniref:nickel import ATP-binding protein NikE n=1 Tax=Vibrio tritonius TaxID=1435069 RepID=UPI00083879A2|nr:nickel import ATP-binding protein NikE [Vibrio tritonius]
MILLTTYHLSHGYKRFSLFHRQTYREVLKDITLNIHSGESVALIGQSGCGKSTFAKTLCGLEIPTVGEVVFRGRTTKQMNQRQRQEMRRHIQMVFQDSVSAVNPRKTIRDIISEPLRHLADMNKEQQDARISELLLSLDLKPSDMNKRPSQMSGGQLQRVCIARALALQPELVILDEALSNLDLVLQIQLIELLKKIQQKTGTAWLLVTHDLRIAQRFCERILVMDNGEIVEECKPGTTTVFEHPASIRLKEAILPPLPTMVTQA